MKDKDYIKAAVELAEGWDHSIGPNGDDLWLDPPGVSPPGPYGGMFHIADVGNVIKDALAAQLARQVDALDKIYVFCGNGTVCIKREAIVRVRDDIILCIDGPDRTMNTIKAIVDSKVLK